MNQCMLHSSVMVVKANLRLDYHCKYSNNRILSIVQRYPIEHQHHEYEAFTAAYAMKQHTNHQGRQGLLLLIMNIDTYSKYTFEEIAQQCKDAVLRNDLRGKVQPSKYEQSYLDACVKTGDVF